MILRPTGISLSDSISAIEESDEFSFFIKPRKFYSPHRKNVEIEHLDMSGPWRQWVKGTGVGDNYKGPIWGSRIYLYHVPEINDIDEARRYFQEEVLEKSYKTDNTLDITGLRYDFLPDAQPERDDGVEIKPHIISIAIKPTGEETGPGYFEWDDIGDYKERILYPPSPHVSWYRMPAAKKMIESGKVGTT